jgi:hypothetical protein
MKYGLGSIMNDLLSKIAGVKAISLRKWHIGIAVVLAVQAAALIVLSVGGRVPLYISYLTSDTLMTSATHISITAPAIHELWSVYLAHILAILLLTTALVYGLTGTVLHKQYQQWTKQGWQPLRWALVACVAGLMLVTLSLIAGGRDIASIKVLVVLPVIAALAYLATEQARLRKQPMSRLVTIVLIVALITSSLLVVWPLICTLLFGSVAVSAYVWWLYGTIFAGWLLIMANEVAKCRKYRQWSSYVLNEIIFMVLLFTLETAFCWQVFAALLHP